MEESALWCYNESMNKQLETDLMEVYSYSPYCKECAKYINRIYSISGKSKKFPSLKKAKSDCQHKLRCHSFSPFISGVHEPAFQCRNIVRYSNRRFADERSPEEIKRYNDWASMVNEMHLCPLIKWLVKLEIARCNVSGTRPNYRKALRIVLPAEKSNPQSRYVRR